jgi:hypothetical protein
VSEPFRFNFTFTLPPELRLEAPTFTFTFALAPELRLEAPTGRHQPGIAGCVLTVDSRGQVAVEGNSREQVFAQARRFLRVIGRGYGPLETAATLRMARQDARERAGVARQDARERAGVARRKTHANALAPEQIIYEPGGGDSWSIVIGADVVIAAAAIAPDVRQHSASRDIRAETPVFAG